MSAIEFVVRASAGNLQRGFVAGEGTNSSLIVQPGADVSLNLSRAQIVSYMRQGNALNITLIDGRVITIDGFFAPDGRQVANLFVSSGGALQQVQLVEGGAGLYYSNYIEVGAGEKWAMGDSLVFDRGTEVMLASGPADDDVGMLAGGLALPGLFGLPLLGLVGLGAGAAALGGGGSSEDRPRDVIDDTEERDPDDDGDDGDSGGDDGDSGGGDDGSGDDDGETGGDGDVRDPDDGGDDDGDVPVDDGDDGDTGGGGDQPDDGDDEDAGGGGGGNGGGGSGGGDNGGGDNGGGGGGNGGGGDGGGGGGDNVGGGGGDHGGGGNGGGGGTPGVVIEIVSGTVDRGHVVNAEDRSTGVVITGTGTVGGTVTVVVNGHTQTTVVDAGGNWSVTFPTSQIPGGTYVTPVEATIQLGDQSSVVRETLSVDTEAFVTFDAHKVGGDGVVNASEAEDGILLTGRTEPGSTVTVVVEGVTYTATVTAGGSWSVTIPAGSVVGGEYSQTAQVFAEDRHGNPAATSGTYVIDTTTFVTVRTDNVGGDGIVNHVERLQGITITGTAEAGATVIVYFGSATRTVLADANGNWSATYGRSDIPTGELTVSVTAVATDLAGNTATAFGSVGVDTLVHPFTLNDPVAGDNVINAAEAAGGVVISGTVEAFSTVVVTFGGVDYTVTAGADGLWQVTLPSTAIAAAEFDATIMAHATDVNGNTAILTHGVRVDTIVNRLDMTRPVEGDNIVTRAEALDGITLSGTVEAGSSVMVTFAGTTRAATVDAQGNWTVDFAHHEIPQGEYTASVTIAATDWVGNTRSITETFLVDTVPPELPMFASMTREADAVRGFSTEATSEAIMVQQINPDGSVSDVVFATSRGPFNGETNFHLAQPVPNGSHLVLTATDAVGNATSTLFMLEETLNNTINVTHPGLSGFNIEQIDLQFAEDSQLTLTVADFEALAAESNLLTIHGGADDTVTALGATRTGETRDISGRSYEVYSFGDNGGTLIIDDTINVVT
ncbi:MAG: hypothetical protein JJT81_08645 [Rubellimicrobium sp.]|nr:hypothetical protein [Rubellimicrobium sp.]